MIDMIHVYIYTNLSAHSSIYLYLHNLHSFWALDKCKSHWHASQYPAVTFLLLIKQSTNQRLPPTPLPHKKGKCKQNTPDNYEKKKKNWKRHSSLDFPTLKAKNFGSFGSLANQRNEAKTISHIAKLNFN